MLEAQTATRATALPNSAIVAVGLMYVSTIKLVSKMVKVSKRLVRGFMLFLQSKGLLFRRFAVEANPLCPTEYKYS